MLINFPINSLELQRKNLNLLYSNYSIYSKVSSLIPFMFESGFMRILEFHLQNCEKAFLDDVNSSFHRTREGVTCW